MSGIYVPVTDWDAALDADYQPAQDYHRHSRCHRPVDEDIARMIAEEEATWRETEADRD